MSDIKFYIPKGETIPTDLRLKVDGMDVDYERIHSGYRFNINTEDEQKALEIATKITDQMKLEHDEPQHGISWRTIAMYVVKQEERYRTGTIVDWKYRVRDSY